MVSSVSTSTLSYYQGQTALSLLNGLSSSNAGTNADALLSYYLGKEGLSGTSSNGQAAAATPPSAPWQASNGVPTVSAAVMGAISAALTVGTPFDACQGALGGVAAAA